MTRLAHVSATLAVIGLLAWLLLATHRGTGQDLPPPGAGEPEGTERRSSGSVVPCAVPLAWRVEAVDPRFGLAEAEARSAVEEAASLWESAVGRPLFRFDPAGGFPIRFIYDHRQARAEQMRRLEGQFGREAADLAARRKALEDLRERYAVEGTRLEERMRELERRIRSRNAAVRRWNESGGAPPEVVRELRAAEEGLQRERREIARKERQLELLRERLKGEAHDLGQRVEDHNRRVEALEREFPPGPVEAGTYREAFLEGRGSITSLRREIRVYRFSNRGELVRVLAHELGHALGLGHGGTPGSLMGEEHVGAWAAGAEVHGSDVASLRALCPEL